MNGIKFTPPGGSVTVQLQSALSVSSAVADAPEAQPGQNVDLKDHSRVANPQSAIRNPPSEVPSSVRLIVSDTGEGISESFLPFVFDRFRQAEGSISRKQGGLGLGLAVARHLVELHGGNIRAESAGPKQGSTFTVELPLAVERRDPERREERQREIERRSNVASVKRLENIRVLLVEDDEDSRNLFSVMLTQQGADVTAISSSAEALVEIEKVLPDVMLSDVGMADGDGYELMRKVRALPAEKGGLTPAIALTGYATRRDRERALAAGYQLHLAKPVEPAELVTAIATLIPKRD